MAENDKYDLVIVGTGFASSFFLKKFLEKTKNKNVKVLVLERGVVFSHSDRLNQIRGVSPSYVKDLVDREDTIINKSKNKPWVFDPNFGGSSNCWWGCTPRLMPNDFKLFSLYNIGADWPFTYEDLESYYCEAEDIMSISGPEVTPYPMSKKYPLPSHKLSTFDRLLQNKYGEGVYMSQPTARASINLPSRNSCCSNYSCNVCPSNAKFTIENGIKYIYGDPRVKIVYGAKVLKLGVQGGKIDSVYYKKNESFFEVFGEVVCLGANAIFNAHILLNSGDDNKHLGKGICEQSGVFAHVYLNKFANVGGSSALTANGYMLYDGMFRRERASCIVENHNIPIIRNEPGKWRDIARFKFVFEDLPESKNTVSLTDNDDRPCVDFKGHSNYVMNSYQYLKDNIESLFKGLPVENVVLDDHFQKTEFHSLSTAKMSLNPEDGVVDQLQIHHRYRNLFVLGGSSFPTVSAANPSLTIAAMSLRSVDLSF